MQYKYSYVRLECVDPMVNSAFEIFFFFFGMFKFQILYIS